MIPLRVKNQLYKSKHIWIIKKWFQNKPAFYFWKKIFQSHTGVVKSKNTFFFLLPSLPIFIWTILYASFIVAVLQYYQHLFPVDPEYFNESIVETFLATVASISGVFLGLYFAAISGITSNFLIEATQDVRLFFLSSPIGKQYLQTVALTGVISVFLILLKAVGYTIHPVGLIFLLLLTTYIIIRFWEVGISVFSGLEPSDTMPWVEKDIIDSVKAAVPPGFKWDKPFLQYHHQNTAIYYFGVMDNLINFGLKKVRLSNEQLVTALKHSARLLFRYSNEKAKIPTQSFWYKKKNQFQSWSLADSSQIIVALNTGTTIQAKVVQDYTWFEEQSLNLAEKVFQSLTKEKQIGFVHQGMEFFTQVAEVYGKDFDVQSIKLLFKKVDGISDYIYEIKTKDTEPLHKEQLAFIDSQGRLAISALLGLTKYIQSQSADNLSKVIKNNKWKSGSSSIYLSGFPLAMLDRLESLVTQINNERLIEGKTISQEWYIEAFCIQKYLYSLETYFLYIKSLHSSYFETKLEKLLNEKQVIFAVHLIQRWLEFSNKYQNLVFTLKKHVSECERFHQLKDLPWPAFDFENEEKEAQGRIKEVTDRMTQLLPHLGSPASDNSLPDYFGHTLTTGIDACYEACKDNDSERLEKMLPAIFRASIEAYNRTKKDVENWSQIESKIIYMSEPLENLFEISGYAKLYSELYKNTKLWDIVKKLWDTYLAAVDAKHVIKFIAEISNFRDTQFTIMPQAVLRTNWQISFEHKMREEGIPVFPDSESYDSVNGRRKPTHTSPVIRVLERSGGLRLMASARDIFFATYLSNLPDAADIELPDRHDFKESIQREEKDVKQKIDDHE